MFIACRPEEMPLQRSAVYVSNERPSGNPKLKLGENENAFPHSL